ncbi:hypothetical protein [Kitasatospora sp. NPDC090091]|uniref:hypothetical protein n=1 Tax=Kitasatospora sp. NPDC090091 TaxID=3364081 RepID=UPI0038144C45
MAQAECKRDDPPGRMPTTSDLQQDLLHLTDRIGLDLLLFEARRFGDRGHVAGHVATPNGLAEGYPDRGLVDSTGGAAAGLHLLVEALQVLGLQLLQAVRAEAGDEVHADSDPRIRRTCSR